MIAKNIIEEEMFDVYQYGFEIMISSAITMLSIMIIACIMDSPLIGILYFIISIPLKVTAGGYHAPTYGKCFLISNLEYIALSLTAKAFSASFMPYYGWIILLMVSAGYILLTCQKSQPSHLRGCTFEKPAPYIPAARHRYGCYNASVSLVAGILSFEFQCVIYCSYCNIYITNQKTKGG